MFGIRARVAVDVTGFQNEPCSSFFVFFFFSRGNTYGMCFICRDEKRRTLDEAERAEIIYEAPFESVTLFFAFVLVFCFGFLSF